jgi:hypothetical protein
VAERLVSVKRAIRWLRGQYRTEHGHYVVTAKRWWSPKERKSARIAARLISLQEEKVALMTRRAALNLALYGTLTTPPAGKGSSTHFRGGWRR